VGRTQRRARRGAVIPRHRGPADRSVARLAIGPQPGAIRIILAPHPVAVDAPGRRALHRAFDVAALARHIEMPAFEIESAGLVERSRRTGPSLRRVAGLARGAAPGRVRVGVAGGAGR